MQSAYAAALTIMQHPQNTAVPAGEQAVISVVAEGNGLSYEWWYAPGNSDVFERSEDEDEIPSQYSFIMDAEHDRCKVYCIISDTYNRVWRTKTATVYMMTPLKIVTQPQNTAALEGEEFTVTVEATGMELTYAWYFANADEDEFSQSNVKVPEYKMEMNDLRAGRRLYCVITDLFGQTVQTDTVVLCKYGPDGLTEGKHCAMCGEVLVAQEVISSPGGENTGSDAVQENDRI